MNESESWIKIQKLVQAGAGHLYIEQFAEYIRNSLTEEQLKPLGNLEDSLKNMVERKPDNIKELLDGLIDLAKKGVILGRR